MFLFKKKKEIPAAKAVPEQQEPIVAVEESPIKVVKASELEKEDKGKTEAEAGVPAPEIIVPSSQVPDEVVDSLLVPVNKGKEISSDKDTTGAVAAIAAAPVSEDKPKIEDKAPAPAAEAAKPKEEAGKDKKPAEGEGGNMFANLFGKVEVEEYNPLANLVNSLPDINMDEVMTEAEEVKGLINEWYKSQGR